jgi:hypothetical protein
MMRCSSGTTVGAVLLTALIGCNVFASTETPAGPTSRSEDGSVTTEQKALAAGVQAVVYGLPLVMMDLTKQSFQNSPAPRGAPINQFLHVRAFPPASFKQVVRVNVDTLYSSAFLDLSAEPLVLSVPDTHGRYYLLPLFDAWTNVFATPGTRTTGNSANSFLIVGPDWSGTAPSGVQVLRSPTNMVWLLGRTQTNGPEDYAAVHSVQDGYKLVPLSKFGTSYVPAKVAVDPDFDAKTPPVEKLKRMSAAQYFDMLARLLKANPPPAADAPVIAKLAAIGIVPGQPFDPSHLDPAVARGLAGSVSVALQKLQEGIEQKATTQSPTGHTANGWRILPMTVGNFGTNYQIRAIVALIALGANLSADAVYPTTYVDAEGKPLNGANHYVLHFDKGKTPPVNAFWSVSMYGPDSFFVENPINRYAISSWMQLQHGSDGSLDIYIQKDSPGKDRESNWLPAPAGDFNLTLRMYWPKDKPISINDGSWVPPGARKLPQSPQ